MIVFLIAGAFLGLVAVLICVPAVIVGARSERFDRHAGQALDLIAADDRNTRLDANANGTGWY